MKKYIDFNTEKRTNATNSFEKGFFKLMINSVYGKTMENLRKRINVILVNNEKDFLKYTSKPTDIAPKIFDKNYAAIHEIKPVLTLNKPIYVGFTVLELSKRLCMTSITTLLKKFNAELLFTDTDSLTYEIRLEDVYEKILSTSICLTLAIFQKTKFYDIQNEMVFGKMKVVSKEIPVNKFVGLKSKMHSMLSDDSEESNTAKGVNIATEFNEFSDTLFNEKVVRHKMKRIQNKKHKLGTYEINKRSLSCFDDKLVLDDGI